MSSRSIGPMHHDISNLRADRSHVDASVHIYYIVVCIMLLKMSPIIRQGGELYLNLLVNRPLLETLETCHNHKPRRRTKHVKTRL